MSAMDAEAFDELDGAISGSDGNGNSDIKVLINGEDVGVDDEGDKEGLFWPCRG